MKYNVFNSIISWSIKKRINQINDFIKQPIITQLNVFNNLIKKSENTIWGRKYNYKKIRNYTDFKKNVPIQTYEDIVPYIKMAKNGEKNVLWPGKVSFFAIQ